MQDRITDLKDDAQENHWGVMSESDACERHQKHRDEAFNSKIDNDQWVLESTGIDAWHEDEDAITKQLRVCIIKHRDGNLSKLEASNTMRLILDKAIQHLEA